RDDALAVLAENLAAQFLPDATYRACGVAGVVQQRQVGLRAAAFGQLTADDQSGAVELVHRVVANVRPGWALAGLEQTHLIVDADRCDGWVHGDTHLAVFGTGDEALRLEVAQQRVRVYQEGLVGVAAVVIEGRQLWGDEEAAIQHQIALDLTYAVDAQVAQQQPELLHVQFRVAATLEVEIAVQHAVLQRAVGIELG